MQRIVLCLIATILTLIWLVFALQNGDEFEEIVDSVHPDEFYFPQLMIVGLQISKLIKIDFKSDKSRVRIKEIGEVKGKRYAEYYFYVMYAVKWTYGLTSLTFMALLASVTNTPSTLIYGIVIAVLLVCHVDGKINDQLKARKEELIAELPQMLSKLALLVNSGMVMRDAWKRVADNGEGILYQEMRVTVKELQNGVSEFTAYRDFGERCAIKEVKRFSSTMLQNLTKANEEVAYLLREMSDEMWEEKRHLAKQKGEKANSKLMIPTAIIFAGIMILVMVPAFMNMGI